MDIHRFVFFQVKNTFFLERELIAGVHRTAYNRYLYNPVQSEKVRHPSKTVHAHT